MFASRFLLAFQGLLSGDPCYFQVRRSNTPNQEDHMARRDRESTLVGT